MTFNVEDGAHQGEITLLTDDGAQAGKINYRQQEDKLIILHTEVDGAYQGKDFGTKLVRKAYAVAEEKGSMVVALCPFAKKVADRHEELSKQTTTLE